MTKFLELIKVLHDGTLANIGLANDLEAIVSSVVKDRWRRSFLDFLAIDKANFDSTSTRLDMTSAAKN